MSRPSEAAYVTGSQPAGTLVVDFEAVRRIIEDGPIDAWHLLDRDDRIDSRRDEIGLIVFLCIHKMTASTTYDR